MKNTAHEKVFAQSGERIEGMEQRPVIKGPDLNEQQSYGEIFDQYINIGFQASNLALGIEQIRKMLRYRLSDDPVGEDDGFPKDPEERKKIGCKIFLGYSSNVVSCGLREVVRYLVQHKLVDVVVSSAGGIEEDFIKCFSKFYLGDFALDGRALRRQQLNRTGNLLVPNENYCAFEEWVLPIFDECLALQRKGFHWTPSRLIWKLGEKIDNKDSIYYWAYVNKIPVFCPGITDGALGDCLYFHSFSNPGLILDVVGDIRAMNSQSLNTARNGVLVVGGGIAKHHCLNCCLFSERGADFAVYVSTAQEFDGSDSGARPDEAISWGKISSDAQPVKIYCDATIALPILVKQAFQTEYENNKEFYDNKKYENPYTYWREMEEDIGVNVEWIKHGKSE